MKEVNEVSKIQGYLDQFDLNSIFSREVKQKLSLYQFQQGDILCSKGDEIQHMYFLVKGKVKISTTSPEGKTLIVRFKTPLAVLGDIEYVKGMHIFNTVEAVTEGFTLGVHFNDLKSMKSNQLEFSQFLLEIITQKFYTESHAASFNMLYPVETRLASYLLSLSSDGEGSMFHEEMQTSNLTEIADVLGTSYRHLNRVVHKLNEEGIIRRKRGALYIADLPRLRERAEGNIYE
ncbi:MULTISPECIES: Crp/Fnr family transcriptional regulator [unclassified Bacillus (in: firmicutes)]|uniref:Crp/Fnr family transcriptional regulator n=1 Tax=unclassified Bacillus (in: firmicutes) TaxID=185979 RepID=UPI0008E7CFAA|nr:MULTISPECIES: cyclic nucleotide-binding domain-containing protein [unclassified Bacillus (in: firmicutes)]SFB09649.1 cAMP-binding domain of CRP or a regulatory subunit of cAMP-dependent protein kinases [Bacillus sp. UNCCL13]SFQ86623.1 cAMP-binding domain of CRP or a regulatory subunit of cAMP-dependent protein kinases [Bacillus sp. cl95]